jgi:uncharacterized phage protein (TIGR02218 family)
MKEISEELKGHMAEEVTMLATCWKLKRRDGEVLGFTDHDRDIEFEGVNYTAASGFTASAVQSSAGLAVDNLDVQGMLSSEYIKEADLHAGRYDFAEVEVFKVNYSNLSQGKLPLRSGWLGEVAYGSGQFTAEVRGLSQRLSQKIGSSYSASCRALFGDAKCGKDKDDYKFAAEVTSVEGRQRFDASFLTEEPGYFNYGLVKFLTGMNAGISMEVKDHRGSMVTLALPMPYDIAIGDEFEIFAGCDKNFKTCCAKFSNAVNFRGEPHIPGTDRILETAGTRKR